MEDPFNKKYYVQYGDKYVAFFDISDDTCESFIIFTGLAKEQNHISSLLVFRCLFYMLSIIL